MYLTQLWLVNFRNHARTELALAPGLQLFVGANAQGKSNLMEAVGVVATGRSHRAGHDGELIRWGESWARVRAAVCRRERAVEIDVGLRNEHPGGAAGRAWKGLRLNGVPVQRGRLFGQLLVVVASPEDSAVVMGRPAVRRKMLDVVLAQGSPAYYFTAQRYARALLQRNQLLRTSGARAFDGWNDQVASLGANITVRRRELVRRLGDHAHAIYRVLSGGAEELTLRYLPALPGADEQEMVAAALGTFQRRRSEEVARGMTLVGPHRDDVQLCLDGRELQLYGSRGQQQAVLVALRLAERQVLREETGEDPVFLVDDALTALDESRQAYLLDHLRGTQTLITATTLAAVPQALGEVEVYRVIGGSVERTRAHRA